MQILNKGIFELGKVQQSLIPFGIKASMQRSIRQKELFKMYRYLVYKVISADKFVPCKQNDTDPSP